MDLLFNRLFKGNGDMHDTSYGNVTDHRVLKNEKYIYSILKLESAGLPKQQHLSTMLYGNKYQKP
jgi:hypothetical protein